MSRNLGSLNLSIFNNYELRSFAQRVVEAVASVDGVDPFIIRVAGRIRNLLSDQHEILARPPGDVYTGQLSDADALRDQAFISIKAGLRYHQTRLDAAAAASAEVLMGIVEVHGEFLHLVPYAEESVRIDELLAEFDAPANQVHVQRTALSPDIENLRTANTAFKALLDTRSAANAETAAAPGNWDNRVSLRREINLVLVVLESEIRSSAAPWVSALIGQINEIIASVSPAARRRKTLSDTAEPVPPVIPLPAGPITPLATS